MIDHRRKRARSETRPPIPAARQALARANWNTGSIERIEINEALAAIAIACIQELRLSEAVVNVQACA